MSDSPTVLAPVMLDVDTGVDDAMAIALAIELRTRLIGISTVAGNVSIDLATANTRRVLAWLGADSVPVHRGASRPLVVDSLDAVHVHGENGLGGAELRDPVAPESHIDAVHAMLLNAEHYRGDLVLVALGPLTNVAMALNIRPQIVRQVRKLVVMSGAYFTNGNVTPHAEFNAHADPHATQQVMAADWNDLVAIGLDVTQETALVRAQWEAIGHQVSCSAELVRRTAARTFDVRGMHGLYIHDALAVAVACDPSLVETKPLEVNVVLDPDRQGQTVPDGAGNVQVATAVDAEAFEVLFAERLGIQKRVQQIQRDTTD